VHAIYHTGYIHISCYWITWLLHLYLHAFESRIKVDQCRTWKGTRHYIQVYELQCVAYHRVLQEEIICAYSTAIDLYLPGRGHSNAASPTAIDHMGNFAEGSLSEPYCMWSNCAVFVIHAM
jgi:hypothetical protein